jgi:hypothetical protein
MPKRRTVPKLKRLSALSRKDVTREEYNQLVDLLNRRGEIIAAIQRELETQFKRMAQMQSELDEIRRASTRARPKEE